MYYHILMCMANMTLSIPDELYKKMKTFTEIRWSEIARKAFQQRIEDLLIAESIAKKSELTKKDAEALSNLIKKTATKRYLNENNN